MTRVLKHLKYPFKYPGLIPRSLSNYARMYVLRQPRLRAVEFAINYECQCRCDHCSAAFLRQDDGRALTTSQMKAAVEAMWRLGALNINLTGGEALLHPDIEEIVRAAHPRSTVVSVATNGIPLDAEAARRLARAGVRIVTISLDSADPETHDRFRAYPGCYRKAMEATEHCLAAGIEVFWCTVMTRTNVEDGDLLRMVRMAAERRIMLTINKPCPVGRWWDRELALSEEARRLHAELMALPHVRWEGHSNYRKEGCPAGIEKLYISPYGDVMPCPFIHISYGNLREEPLPVIWKRMLRTSSFNEVRAGCPISEDPEFARRILEPIYRQDQHPVRYSDHPSERGESQ